MEQIIHSQLRGSPVYNKLK